MSKFDNRVQGDVISHAKQVKKQMPKGYEHFVTMLYGSQNYDLATETSDVDTKTMVFPTLEDIVLGKKMLSAVYNMDDGSLDTCKDYRDMFNNYMKGNVNFVETLYTRYYEINPLFVPYWQALRENRDMIANANPSRLMHQIGGMAVQKYKAMEHPFESKVETLAKYGYDPKQLHHIVRLRVFAETYLENKDFGSCLVPNDNVIEYIRSLKTDPISLDNAREVAEKEMAKIDNLISEGDIKFANDNQSDKVREFFDDIIIGMFETYIMFTR